MKIGKYEYTRCSKAQPCPVCGRHKYCLLGNNGRVAVCTKVQEGAYRALNFGYLHFLNGHTHTIVPEKNDDLIPDASAVFRVYKQLSFFRDDMEPLANALRISPVALLLLGVGYSEKKRCWMFPMYNEKRHMIGLKCRNLKGNKWCFKGSRLGVYMSRVFNPHQMILVCEGESDTAACLGLGYNAIGRASAQTCMKIIPELVKNNQHIYVFADRDEDGLGLRSSERLIEHIGRGTIIYNKEYKDVREWVLADEFSLKNVLQYVYKRDNQ